MLCLREVAFRICIRMCATYVRLVKKERYSTGSVSQVLRSRLIVMWEMPQILIINPVLAARGFLNYASPHDWA